MDNVKEMLQKEIIDNIKYAARNYDLDHLKSIADERDTVTLYHGTSTYYLNRILQEGILPRDQTGNDNWGEKAQSNEGIVYLTNKWHYWYAYHATEKLLEDKYGDDWSSIPEAQWWLRRNPLPVYIECQIPKAFLTFDEDIVYTKFFKSKLKAAIRKQEDARIEISWQESLAQSGTVGVRGGIPAKYIKSFTVLGDGKLYLDLMGDNATYKREHSKWVHGQGKGKMKKDELKKLEDKYQMVGTFPVAQLPKGLLISEFGLDRNSNQLSLILNTPEEYLKQPMNLERF